MTVLRLEDSAAIQVTSGALRLPEDGFRIVDRIAGNTFDGTAHERAMPVLASRLGTTSGTTGATGETGRRGGSHGPDNRFHDGQSKGATLKALTRLRAAQLIWRANLEN